MPIQSHPEKDPVSGLRPLQEEFIEWVTSDDRQGSQAEWARQHGISPSLITYWKRDDFAFQRALQRRMVEVGLDAVSILDIVRGLKVKAANGDSQAANAILGFLKYLQPEGQLTDVEKDASDLSDEELQAALEHELKLAAGHDETANE